MRLRWPCVSLITKISALRPGELPTREGTPISDDEAHEAGDGDRRRHGQANQSPMTTLTQLPAQLVLESWSFGPNQKPPRAVIVDLQ
jgi:hypothetical protein